MDNVHILQHFFCKGIGIMFASILACELFGGNQPPAHHPEKLMALLTQGLSVIVCDKPCTDYSSSHISYLLPLS